LTPATTLRPQKFRLTSSRLQANLAQVKMVMPFGVGGMESEPESGMLKAVALEFPLMCHIVSLWRASYFALGKETKRPTGIHENSRFTMQIPPSFSGFIQPAKSRSIKANKGESR
jgi:hypothetical protein